METEAIVIGAGISGLATAKSMKDVGYNVTVLERTGSVGGLWTFKEKNYGVMKFTHINVSKHNYCFSDYPIPDDTPDYLHNTELADYINGYVKHFGLEENIKFHRQVNLVQRRDDQKWEVDVEIVEEDDKGAITPTGKTEKYVCSFVAVASGHHSKPKYPDFPGLNTFKGDAVHSVDYKDAVLNDVIDKKVLVVGIGNSAIDVACNAASVGRCKPVYISTRSGAWIFPNYIFGYPTDHYACRLFLSLPWRVGTFILETIINTIQGHPNKWGLKPKMRMLQTQPTVSPTFLHHLQRKEIIVAPDIKKIDGKSVTFDDGKTEEFDKIILCTGYSIDLPFLSQETKKHFLDDSNNSIKLYKNVFCPEVGHTLALIGFVQPASGGVLTMSEIQARWWAELCRNRVILPMKDDMKKSINEDLEYVKKRWFHSNRHTIQKDPILYNDEVASFFGAKPEFKDNPSLAWRLLIGSCGAAQWRLQGPGKWDKAAETVRNVPVAAFYVYGGLFALILVFWFLWYLLSVVSYQIFG